MKYDFLKDEVLKNRLISRNRRDKVVSILKREDTVKPNSFVFEFYEKDDKLLSFNMLSEEQINTLFLNEIRKEKLLKINLVCLEKEKPKKLVSRKK